LYVGATIALGAALVVGLALASRRWGEMPGRSPEGPRERGDRIRPAWTVVVTMLAAGALAGMAGMIEVAGVAHRLHLDLSPGFGYIGILVALVAAFSPLWIVTTAVVFGALVVGGWALRDLGVAWWMVTTLQVVIAAIVLGAALLARFRLRSSEVRVREATPI
jgi:simple sugar transport system permease protein